MEGCDLYLNVFLKKVMLQELFEEILTIAVTLHI